MASEALISIVIPVRDRAGIVGRTLESVKAQKLRPLNVILVDNASSDGTLELLEEWKRENQTPDFSITVVEETSPGAAAARNRGLEIVDTPYVLFFDSDDLMSPDLTLRAAESLKANPDADIVGWDIVINFINSKTKVCRFSTKDPLYNHIFHTLLSTVRYVVRTSFIRNAGGWDPTIRGWDDYELGVRLLLHQPRLAYIGKGIVVDVMCQTESISGTSFSPTPQLWEYALDKISAILAENSKTEELKYIELRRIILSGLYAREGALGESSRLLGEVLSRTASRYRRMVYKLFHVFVAHGGRGVAQIAKIICP